MLSGWWLIFAIFFWTGLFFGWPIFISVVLFMSVVMLVLRSKWKELLVVWPIMFFMAFIGCWAGKRIVPDWRQIIPTGAQFTVSGIVRTIDLTDRRRALIQVRYLWFDGRKYVFPYKIWVWRKKGWVGGDIGRSIRVQLSVSKRKWLWVSSVLFEDNRNWMGWFYWATFGLRKLAYENMKSLPPNIRALCASVILGVKDYRYFPVIRKKFSAVGLAHVLAISGLHLGILTMILFAFLQLFGVHWAVDLLVVTILMWGYCIMIPESSSLFRAAVMLSWFTVSCIMKRRWSIYDILGLTIFTVAFVDPLQLFSKGFIMSFVAVFSICLGFSLFNVIIGWFRWFLVGGFATLGLAGIIVKWFGCLSIIGMLVSPLVVMLLVLLILGGLSFIITGGMVGREFVEFISSSMLWCVDWLNKHNIVFCKSGLSDFCVICYYFTLTLIILMIGIIEYRRQCDGFGDSGIIGS